MYTLSRYGNLTPPHNWMRHEIEHSNVEEKRTVPKIIQDNPKEKERRSIPKEKRIGPNSNKK
jgi:hypothetical protein